jgi:hypothetical protein
VMAESEGEIKRRVFCELLREAFNATPPEWVDIQAGKKALVFGQWFVVYDTGSIVVPSNENKVTKWLQKAKEDLEAMEWHEMLEIAFKNKN